LLAAPLAGRAQQPDRVGRRTTAEVSVGRTTRVPGQADEGRGPLVSTAVRLPVWGPHLRVVLGASYSRVRPSSFLGDAGARPFYAFESALAVVGPALSFGTSPRVGLDVQWNPAVTRTRVVRTPPPGYRTPGSWRPTYSTFSAGGQVLVPVGHRGPLIGIGGRLFAGLSPIGVAFGAMPVWSALQVTVRSR
jgi:hypothetical protein